MPPGASLHEIAALLGHPVRWALLQSLSAGDLRVNELVARGDASQSLVSYHLGLLRGAGVVSEHRSTADARDSYYHLNREAVGHKISRIAGALHPSLSAPPPDPAAARGTVLFLCTANSARSQIAEALLRSETAGRVTAISAGSDPSVVDPLALRVLRERGIETQGLRSKHWQDLGRVQVDRVVTLCDIVREVLPERLTRDAVHWSLPDPAAAGGSLRQRLAIFRRTVDETEARVSGLIAELAA